MPIFRVKFVRDDNNMDNFVHIGPYSRGEWREMLLNVDDKETALKVAQERNEEYFPEDYAVDSGKVDEDGEPVMIPRPDLAQSNYKLQSVEEVG